jgi:hypothetical protein
MLRGFWNAIRTSTGDRSITKERYIKSVPADVTAAMTKMNDAIHASIMHKPPTVT